MSIITTNLDEFNMLSVCQELVQQEESQRIGNNFIYHPQLSGLNKYNVIKEVLLLLRDKNLMEILGEEPPASGGEGSFRVKLLPGFRKFYNELVKNPNILTSTPSIQPKKSNNWWQGDFRWEGNKFIFGNYGEIEFSGSRKTLFIELAEAKGEWVPIRKLESKAKNAATVLGQMRKRLEHKTNKGITVQSTEDVNPIERPSEWSYRLNLYKV